MSDQFENAMQLARSAFNAGNEEEAKSFCNQALTINPNSVQAKVLKGAAVLISFTMAGAARDAKEAFSLWKEASASSEFGDTERDMITNAAIGFVNTWYKAGEAHYQQFKSLNSASEDRDGVRKSCDIFLGNITAIKGMDSYAPFIKAAVLNYFKDSMSGDFEIRDSFKKKYTAITGEKAPGCYIATAVYGSYNAPEVMTLRRFRDECLAESVAGCLFINIYYAISPRIADRLRDANRINKFVRNILDKFVAHVNRNLPNLKDGRKAC
jgi:hypothetical protein